MIKPILSNNIILIGMPGAGKSTIGVILAKMTARNFIDTDVLIQSSQHRTLQDIVDHDGYLALRSIEEAVLLGLSVQNHVIATGGSAVYSDKAMAHLKSLGPVVFLDISLPTLETRLQDASTRGIARQPGQTLADLLRERLPMYKKHADLTIACDGMTQEKICEKIIAGMTGKENP